FQKLPHHTGIKTGSVKAQPRVPPKGRVSSIWEILIKAARKPIKMFSGGFFFFPFRRMAAYIAKLLHF
ncbi:MAG: hypothetical protein Q3966_04860, partial [Neisseria sp.]|nr:hypothetical protein [Neisseria sp.]